VSGIDLQAWQPMDERKEAFFAKVPMLLEMKGRFHQVAKFAYEIGKLDRIINVENIQLSTPKKKGRHRPEGAVPRHDVPHDRQGGGGAEEMNRYLSTGMRLAVAFLPLALIACGSDAVSHGPDTAPAAKPAAAAAPSAAKVGPE